MQEQSVKIAHEKYDSKIIFSHLSTHLIKKLFSNPYLINFLEVKASRIFISSYLSNNAIKFELTSR